MTSISKGFVRAHEGHLVDGAGRRTMLRGVGLGSWLLPEGYMFRFFPPAPQSPREIEAFVTALVGEEHASEFWCGFQEHWTSERDIAAIAAADMNHVRLPINARVVMDDRGRLIDHGIGLVDRLIEWCRRHGLWVILDLHGAPGGQTGTNIDDSPNGEPELFTDRRYREQTVRLWRLLASRYRDDTTVAGYDLLNEPLPEPHWREHSGALADLYRELTAAIRAVDPNHLLIYEGTQWATNWDIFTEVWDDNSALSFHKYWSPPDRGSIAAFLTRRDALGLPIYMGEGGEHGLGWLQTAFQLYDDYDISWNFWPWKKIDTYSSPCSVASPAGWIEILDYARGGPHPPDALATLDALLEGMKLENCVYRPEVIAALRRLAPVRLSAAAFGFRGAGRSYQTTDAVPSPLFRADESVTVRPIGASRVTFDYTDGPDRLEPLWQVELCAGDWLSYEFGLREEAEVAIVVEGDGVVELTIDGLELPARLHAGRHEARITCRSETAVIAAVSIAPVASQALNDDYALADGT
ncbi:MAG: cellulase family glycosylhydrolase [Acidobacteriota bacterium]|nr:cellulase family glycosylhydrolase [Acidobacteriota bacterium]